MKPHESIREARLIAGLTLAKVAAECGMSVPSLSAIESGKRNVTLDTVERIAKALGTKVSLIFETNIET